MVAFGHQPKTRQQHQQVTTGLTLQLACAQQVRILQTALRQQRIDDALGRRRRKLGVVGYRVHAFLLCCPDFTSSTCQAVHMNTHYVQKKNPGMAGVPSTANAVVIDAQPG